MESGRRIAAQVQKRPLLDPVTDGGEGWRMVVLVEKRERVLHDSHCITPAGLLGVDKTYDRVARVFWARSVS